jgi:hypothetical protein
VYERAACVVLQCTGLCGCVCEQRGW